MIVCDDGAFIHAWHSGWPGSAHNATVFEDSELATSLAEFFAVSEYLLGDSACACIQNLISAFKKPWGAAIP